MVWDEVERETTAVPEICWGDRLVNGSEPTKPWEVAWAAGVVGMVPVTLATSMKPVEPYCQEATVAVLQTPWLVRAKVDPHHELTVFSDGRAIVRGTTDPGRARSLYARFVGV